MQEQYFACISKVGDSFPIDNQILVATKTNDRRIERECKETEIKIQVKYCGLSKLDYQVRKGIFPLWNHNSFNQQCIIPGYEVCGQILNIGNKVNSKMFSIGDLVIGFLPVQTIPTKENNLIFNNEISNDTFLLSDNNVDELNGGCSNECISEAHYFLKIPSDMSLIKSASCIFSGIRAYITLFNKTQIKRGDTICIMKGAHWEQTYLLQLAILKCNCQVITTVTTDEEINFLRMIQSKLNSKLSNSLIINGNMNSNLHQLTILDLRQYENMEQFQKAIFKETSGLGVDVFICSDYLPIISSNNNNSLTTALNVIKSNGTLVCYDFNNQLTEQHFNQMFRKSINLANILEQSYVQHPHTIGIYLRK